MLDFSILFKLGAMGIVVTVIDQVLRTNKKENIAVAVDVIGTIIILGIVIKYTADLFNTIRTIFMF